MIALVCDQHVAYRIYKKTQSENVRPTVKALNRGAPVTKVFIIKLQATATRLYKSFFVIPLAMTKSKKVVHVVADFYICWVICMAGRPTGRGTGAAPAGAPGAPGAFLGLTGIWVVLSLMRAR